MFAASRYVRDAVRNLDPTARHIALTIAAYSDRAGTASPSIRQLAEATGRHSHTVTEAIKRCEAAGVFVVDRRNRAVSRYRFPVQDPVAEISPSARVERAVELSPSARVSPQSARARRARLEYLEKNNARNEPSTDETGVFLPGTGRVEYYTARGASCER